jgi:hypothetical protein
MDSMEANPTRLCAAGQAVAPSCVPGLVVAVSHAGHYLCDMKVAEIKGLVERRPFRPFTVRLNNGAQYSFKDARDVGAPKDFRLIIYFGKSEAVRIDTDSIVEIFER